MKNIFNKMTDTKFPFVSIVITTKNEEENIKNCLKSITCQNYPQKKIEIIVVDNNSQDKTKEIAYNYTAKVFNKSPERLAQRNFGIKKSQGKYFLFLDADMILKKDLIRNCIEEVTNNKKMGSVYTQANHW